MPQRPFFDGIAAAFPCSVQDFFSFLLLLTARIPAICQYPCVKQVFDFSLLEDFDHLNRYANLLERCRGLQGRNPLFSALHPCTLCVPARSVQRIFCSSIRSCTLRLFSLSHSSISFFLKI